MTTCPNFQSKQQIGFACTLHDPSVLLTLDLTLGTLQQFSSFLSACETPQTRVRHWSNTSTDKRLIPKSNAQGSSEKTNTMSTCFKKGYLTHTHTHTHACSEPSYRILMWNATDVQKTATGKLTRGMKLYIYRSVITVDIDRINQQR